MVADNERLTVLVLPINLIWKLKIHIRQRIILGILLTLTIFVIVTAIVRVTIVLEQSRQLDLTWIFTWSAIEQTVG